jgi:MFS family permease
MVGCNLVAGAALMALVIAMSLGSADLLMAYLVAIILAPCDVTFTLAMQASVPLLAPNPDQLGVANGRLMAVEGAGQQFIGPGSGGYLFALARRLPFFADAVSFLISAFLVSSSLPRARREGLHARPSGRHVADLRDPSTGSYVADLRDPSTGSYVADLRDDVSGPTDAEADADADAHRSAPGPSGAGAYRAATALSGAGAYQPAPGLSGTSARLPGSADEFDLGTAAGRDDLAKARGRHTSGWVAAFLEGLRVFRREPSLRMLAATVSAVAFSQFMVVGVLVVYGTRTLHLTSTRYGLFIAVASLVGVVGAFSAGGLQRRFGAGRLIVGGAAAASLSYIGLSFARSAVLAVFVLGLQDFGVAVANVASLTARQRLVPRSLLGRVSSVHRLAVLGAAPFGAVVGGFIASVSNAPDAMLAAGLILGAALAIFSAPLLRSLAASARSDLPESPAPTAQPAGP